MLVGAGPGDPGLLTLRALRALQNADVVLYDRLVSAEVLDLARRDAERIYVGKAAGKAHVSQEDINALLVKLAKQGKRVCRLKGGDPFIFGRGGEELEALAADRHSLRSRARHHRRRGLRRVCRHPAHASRSRAGADVRHGPLQGRDLTNVDWELLSRPGQTAVFYMGLSHLDNIVAQLARARRAGGSRRRSDRAGHAALAARRHRHACRSGRRVREAGIESPALLIVGEVTRLHETLHWFNARGAIGRAAQRRCSTCRALHEGRLTA